MRILVIGGSVFLGRAVVAEAQAAGHDVTVFNRGVSGAPLDGVTHVRGDRTVRADVEALAGRSFDVVVDTCGYVPTDVRTSAEVLAPSTAHYAFVSTVNVYPGWPAQADYESAGVFDGDPDAGPDDLPDGIVDAAAYGWRKVGCERAVERAFGADRCSVLRGGVIVGPDDSAVGRLPWWIDRVARGGEVLVPGRADDLVSMIDARDLARFALSAVPGVFQTTGPDRDTRGDLVDACRSATSSDATFTYVEDEDWLATQGVEPWTELPLWLPHADGPGTFVHDTAAAERAGLVWRPLVETIADTWDWQRSLPGGWQPAAMTPGLPAQRERDILAAWHATRPQGGSADD